MSSLFPAYLVADEAQLIDVFISEATNFGVSQKDAERLFKILPGKVRAAPAKKFKLDQEWRYEYGKPFHLDGNSKGFGVPYQAPLVISLIRTALVAERALTQTQRRPGSAWWYQLEKPEKHFDGIVEMLAVANVNQNYSLAYEQAGLGVGSYRIDWLLQTKENGNFLLEVKNRPGQSAQELTRIQSTSRIRRGSPPTVSEPIADFDALFKSSSNKFLPESTSGYIQGVILFLGIKIPSEQFAVFFHDHLQTNLHFVAIGKEDQKSGVSVNILAISPEIENNVRSAFGWSEHADLMY